MGYVVQVNRSGGGVPKTPVAEAVIGEMGIEGDGHDDRQNHGGPERALCLWTVEAIAGLQEEGHPIGPGTAGENVLLAGVDWAAVVPGARLQLGPEVLVEVTRYTTPCKTIVASFTDGDFNRIHHNLYPGWSRVYARVLEGGTLRPGDGVEVLAPATV